MSKCNILVPCPCSPGVDLNTLNPFTRHAPVIRNRTNCYGLVHTKKGGVQITVTRNLTLLCLKFLHSNIYNRDFRFNKLSFWPATSFIMASCYYKTSLIKHLQVYNTMLTPSLSGIWHMTFGTVFLPINICYTQKLGIHLHFWSLKAY